MAFTEFNPEVGKKDDGVGIGDIKEYKTIYLFHGLTGNHTDWIRRSSIERYVGEYGVAAIMPEVDRSWYTDIRLNSLLKTFNVYKFHLCYYNK